VDEAREKKPAGPHDPIALPARIYCPRCRSTDIRKSRKRFSDLPAMLAGFRPARCYMCSYRFRYNLAISIHVAGDNRHEAA
jgi:predicted Zn-ribbon and HTH transcriptional regulator